VPLPKGVDYGFGYTLGKVCQSLATVPESCFLLADVTRHLGWA